MKKVLISISGINRSINFEWLINSYKGTTFKLTFLLINPGGDSFITFLQKKGIEYHIIKEKQRPLLFIKVLNFILKSNPVLIHSHYRDSNNTTIPIARLLNKKVIYTRHNSTYNHLYFPNAVKVDKIINRLSSKIISISQVTYNTLIKEGVNETKILRLPHGFNFKAMAEDGDKLKDLMKKKYHLDNKFCIGVIARYISWKGHRYVIEAFKKIKIQIPNAYLVLVNTNGPDSKQIKQLLIDNLETDEYVEIAYEPNIFGLYKNFNVYVHVPFDNQIEAFGQTYIEALALKIPSVFTKSGIANEFIQHNYNAYVVPHKNSYEIVTGILKIKNDEKYRNKIIENGYKSIQPFNFDNHLSNLLSIYNEVLKNETKH